jgi:23S rRNA pseudouridine1911/1915/1917 synthase
MPAKSKPNRRFLPRGLIILHEDDDILVVEKPAGFLTMGTEKEKTRTVYHALTDYVRRGIAWSRERVFIVHRLDRDTSGLLVFARNIRAKTALQGNWKNTRKKYLAIVHGRCEKAEETITSYLAENAAGVVYSTPDVSKGKLSHTGYRVLRLGRNHSLLEVDPKTGRKNQIRVHLADIGHPVVGDSKYGTPDKSRKRLALHAATLTFHHPSNGKVMSFETPAPEYFEQILGAPAGPAERSVSESPAPPREERMVQPRKGPGRPKSKEIQTSEGPKATPRQGLGRGDDKYSRPAEGRKAQPRKGPESRDGEERPPRERYKGNRREGISGSSEKDIPPSPKRHKGKPWEGMAGKSAKDSPSPREKSKTKPLKGPGRGKTAGNSRKRGK